MLECGNEQKYHLYMKTIYPHAASAEDHGAEQLDAEKRKGGKGFHLDSFGGFPLFFWLYLVFSHSKSHMDVGFFL